MCVDHGPTISEEEAEPPIPGKRLVYALTILY